jgi:predicted methyltransferase
MAIKGRKIFDMLLSNSLAISHGMIRKTVKPGDIVADATMGNGNDTLLLAELVGEKGKVYSFDIQDTALINTGKKLRDKGIPDIVELIKDGHQNIDIYVPKGIRAVMFNLGYLPKGDHSIGTKAETTIEALKKSLELLMDGGIITMVIYYGGDSGFEEKEAVLEYVRTIDCRKYSVLVCDFVNQINCPPIAVCIEKVVQI